MGHVFDIIASPVKKPNPKPTPTHSPHKKHSNTWSYLGLVIIIFLIVADVSNNSNNKNQTQITPVSQNQNSSESKVLGESNNQSTEQNSTPATDTTTLSNTQESTATNNQTNQNTFEISQIKIRILNGSRTAGAATATKEKLEKQGFVVDSIGTAKNKYNNSIIYYNKDKKSVAAMVQLALENQNITLEQNPSLAGNYDVLVIIGAK